MIVLGILIKNNIYQWSHHHLNHELLEIVVIVGIVFAVLVFICKREKEEKSDHILQIISCTNKTCALIFCNTNINVVDKKHILFSGVELSEEVF